MLFSHEINRLVIGVLCAFGVIVLSAAYWAIFGPDTIAARQDNPRVFEAEAQIRRGSVFDRNGILLTESVQDTVSTSRRVYLHEAMYSALGYYSLKYGVSSAEAAYDTILRGDDLTRDLGTYLTRDLLHRPQRGSDIRLTFDLIVQQALVQAMSGRAGAAIVLSVPGGEVLALVSLPTFNPNSLDDDWAALASAPGNPFFNRVLQGRYQPGGTLQTALIAAAVTNGISLDERGNDGAQPLLISGVELTCVKPPALTSLSLREAYMYGCPYPFAQLANNLGTVTLQSLFETFRIVPQSALTGFVPQPAISLTESDLNPTNDPVDMALGQGSMTVSPFEMVLITAAIAGDGNAPVPQALLGIRPPGTRDWVSASQPHPSIPIVTANAALELQELMRLTIRDGTASAAANPAPDMGGHTALAYSGSEVQSWFIGFAGLDERQSVVIALVLENTNDPDLVARIGGDSLALAQSRLSISLPARP